MLTIEKINDDYTVLAITRNGVTWEIQVEIDPDPDGGISVAVCRESEYCTGAEFGWDEKHQNEIQGY
jgi:hypothetical protein